MPVLPPYNLSGLTFVSAFLQLLQFGRRASKFRSEAPRTRMWGDGFPLFSRPSSRRRRCQVRNEIKATAKLASLGLVLSRPRLSRRRFASKEIQFGRGQISEMVLSSGEPDAVADGVSLLTSRHERGRRCHSIQRGGCQTNKKAQRASLSNYAGRRGVHPISSR